MIAPLAVRVLVLVERREASPLLPMRVLGSRNVRVITGATVLVGAGYLGTSSSPRSTCRGCWDLPQR